MKSRSMIERLKQLLSRYERPLFIALGAALLTVFLMNLEFNLLESSLYDFRMRTGAQPRPDSRIVLIALDDDTARFANEYHPLPLDLHVRALERLEGYRPQAVGYLVDMNRVSQSYPELLRSDWSSRFVSVASRMESQGIPFMLGTGFDVNGEVVPPYPVSTLPHSVAVIHKDGNVFGEDKITRRALLRLYEEPAFHLALAQRLGFLQVGGTIRGEFKEAPIDADYFFFRYHGNSGFGTGVREQTLYPVHSFRDLLEGKLAPHDLEGKIVLVGSMSRDDSGDFTFTPYSKRPFVNPKLVVHANILDSVMNQQAILRAPELLNWFFTFLAAFFVIWSVFNTTPLYGVFNTVALAVGFILVGQILFSLRGFWIRESQPLVGIFLSYYLAVPYRLIQEYKRRWDYQRKNEILVQVEEMKTNFLRLVTHDLKTPVARIQGLAEMTLRRIGSSLSEHEREPLESITRSTEELNHFISSILELTKIESNRVVLNLESKDVNLLVERTVDRLSPLAERNQIGIELELEPLFPIRVDTGLIEKVLTNVIDNAIKYSRQGSTIRIATAEKNDFVLISIEDQGIGLSPEELSNLFTRFYRAKNDQTTRISGTGLGLYLTRYFIEAHQGRVEVSSEQGKGTLFRIHLPVNLHVQAGLTRTIMTENRDRTGSEGK